MSLEGLEFISDKHLFFKVLIQNCSVLQKEACNLISAGFPGKLHLFSCLLSEGTCTLQLFSTKTFFQLVSDY